MLDHRRATDRRLDAAGAALLLQRSAFQHSAQHSTQHSAPGRPAQVPAPAAPQRSPSPGAHRVVELDPSRPAAALAVLDLTDDACTELVACPLCSVLFDPLWLFQHVAVDH